ncbi:MAG: hypothetical protein AMJ78_08340 [Omnitrophica WOR_2 bacterium SM23_29]|nr:MAG: hypothetical protein AMJ78_08340 [Omnitrophica WOR_2 bacterium SM23_29]
MKKISISLLLSFLVLSLSGCEIKFTAFTKIKPDGSGFRITTYSAETEGEKEELLNRHILLEGGIWKKQKYTPSWSKVEGERHIYETRRFFKDFNKLASDYARKGFNPKDLSENRYEFKIKKGLIFDTYEYREIFTDSTNERKLREFCEREYNYVLNLASRRLEDTLPKLIEKEKVRTFLYGKYRPYYDYFLDVLLKHGYEAFFKEEIKELIEKYKEFEESISEESFPSLISDFILKDHKDINRDELKNKLKEIHSKISEELQLHQEELSQKNYEDAFGVYGIPLFVSYPFSITVVMPGRIVNSNSKDIKINIAKWVFYPSDFFLKEYKLEAKSRRLNYATIGIFVGIVAILILANLRNIRKLRK